MTIKIQGRTVHADEAVTNVTIREVFGEDVLVITGGQVEMMAEGRFRIVAKHMTACDEEGDGSFVALLEGAGLRLDYLFPRSVRLTGVILHARFYTEEPTVTKVKGREEPFLAYVPPEQPWRSDLYKIEVRFLPEGKD